MNSSVLSFFLIFLLLCFVNKATSWRFKFSWRYSRLRKVEFSLARFQRRGRKDYVCFSELSIDSVYTSDEDAPFVGEFACGQFQTRARAAIFLFYRHSSWPRATAAFYFIPVFYPSCLVIRRYYERATKSDQDLRRVFHNGLRAVRKAPLPTPR